VSSFERSARRRQRPAIRDYSAYWLDAVRDPEADDHVFVRVGIGPEGAAPAAFLNLCSCTLDGFFSDLRLAVVEAELNGAAHFAGGEEP